MTDDEHQAHRIISRWIHKKTGVSEFERLLRKLGWVKVQYLARAGRAVNPIGTYIDEPTKGTK